MITKQSAPIAARGVVSLVLGIVIGLSVGFAWARLDSSADPAETTAAGPFSQAPGEAVQDLATLHLAFDERAEQTLREARARAIARGGLEQRASDIVDAEVRVTAPGELADPLRARVRLKGDFNDHLDTDKWSLRIEFSDGKRLGMRRLSVQHPKTRGFIAEWLVMAFARQRGLLAPRSRFVNVVINGRPSGVYYLEEHFAKELLESQGRRDGPIVRFREESLWSTWLQHDVQSGVAIPRGVEPATTALFAEVDTFERGRMLRDTGLRPRVQRGLEHLLQLQRGLRAGKLAFPHSDPAQAHRRRLAAFDRARAGFVDDVFAVDKLGAWLAVATLWGAEHGLGWHQWRFYHDPVLDRLEPVLFDMGPSFLQLQSRAALLIDNPLLRDLTSNARVREIAYRRLWEMSEASAVDEFFASIAAPYAAAVRALAADGSTIPPGVDAAHFLGEFERAFRDHAAFVHRVVAPADGANFRCRLADAPADGDRANPTFEIEAWAITESPVLIDGFRFSNGKFVAAAAAAPDCDASLLRDHGRVALPRIPRFAKFRVPADARLFGLRTIEELIRAAREMAESGGGAARLELDVEYRLAADGEPRSEALRVLPVEPGPSVGRPAAPTLQAALEQHACLRHDVDTGQLWLRAGTWDVQGDLIVPAEEPLRSAGGVTLRFDVGAAFVANAALEFVGEPDAPIVLEPAGEGPWGGVVVLAANERTNWRHVHVRRAGAIARGGWQTTGGVTFYRSPVRFEHTRIQDAAGEDALNVFGAHCELVDSVFDGGVSDLFDGDFVTGFARGCSFARSVEDAIDVSGSSFAVEDCEFEAIGDKAVSVGERSHATVTGGLIRSCSIGIAAKDESTVEVDALRIESAEQFALCAYIKKAEFGPSAIVARDVELGECGRAPTLVQTRCSIELDGESMPAVDVDVERLYREKVLGK